MKSGRRLPPVSMRVASRASTFSSSFYALVAAALLFSSFLVASVSAQSSASKFLTLSGNAPLVIARGGFSGLFPDSSSAAYQLALATSVANVVLWCDVQLTKDQVGICAPQVTLENSTDIAAVYQKRYSTYLLNGVATKGWFSVDFTTTELQSVILTQGVYSRTNKLDGNMFPIQTVEDVAAQKPPALWLNIQHDIFFSQHNMSMRSYIISSIRRVVISYISSPEVSFLQSIASRVPMTTKLIFRFLEDSNTVEPSTNQTYGNLLKNLTAIKTFASGILVPKSYIWRVDASLYLQGHTSLVSDAHKVGLEVFASDFYNDVPFSYNYSYDPVTEYLSFTDNDNFSVDGVLSDFPITASEAIDCFAHLGKNATAQVNVPVISKNGASGDYPGCTDIAYENAITDGADFIDCPVQMSKDGIPFCLSSVNLIDSTNVVSTKFSSLSTTIPELMSRSGIFTFSLDWADIESLTPAISNPEASYELFRNPRFKSAGKLITLSNFLDLAKNASSLSGVVISVENAAYLIAQQKLSVVDTVLEALSKAGYEKQTSLKVMVQSSNSPVLMKLKGNTNYELVYVVDENIRDADASAVADIKKFADSVVVSKESVFPVNAAFIIGVTDVVSKLQASNLSVYVETFANEFVTQPWDFFADPTVEINSHVMGANVSGIITEFPQTAARYKRNRCLNQGNNTPSYMSPVQPGSLFTLITSRYLPPAEAPNPVLDQSDVVESPLPSITVEAPTPGAAAGTTAPAPKGNGQPNIVGSIFLSCFAMIFSILLLL